MARTRVTRQYAVVAVAAILASLLVLGWSAFGLGPGFPLDDGWIHQTYARNLAETGQWAYVPGEVSAGSTAPLWTLLLAAGYLLNIPYLWWTYFLGIGCLVWVGWVGMLLWQELWPERAAQGWITGVVLVLSWPLLWAAGSGMETLFFLALSLSLLVLYVRPGPSGVRLGLLGGLLVLVRPEGIILLLLLVAGLLTRREARVLVSFLGVLFLLLLPYFVVNLSLSGQLWPNTLYAKQAEYATLQLRPLPFRFVHLLFFSLGGPEMGWRGMSGAHLLLLPGLLLAGWQALRADWSRRRMWYTVPLLWAGGHVLAYAWRLPVTYQHGRYLWAALPVWILYGLCGWGTLLVGMKARWGHRGRLLGRVAFLSFFLLLFLFLGLGADAYATDVAFIEEEMVAVARWLRENTEPDALIAAHDIGAIGYFGRRPLLDLAGLVSPEVVPLLTDEERLVRYVLASEARYLVTAPGWPYPPLTDRSDTEMLFETDYPWTREQGMNNMAVYRLPE